jgi:hypothetical protein
LNKTAAKKSNVLIESQRVGIGGYFEALESQFSNPLRDVQHKKLANTSSHVVWVHEEILQLGHTATQEIRGKADHNTVLIYYKPRSTFIDAVLRQSQRCWVLQE